MKVTTPAPHVGEARPGGRTSRTREAVLRATRDILVEHGAGDLRIEEVARRSGVHRSSIYRRWGDVAGIVADLAHDIAAGLDAPATGSLRGDLEALAVQVAARLDGDGSALITALLAWSDPGVRDVLQQFWEERRATVATVLRRHGHEDDPASVTRLLAGPLYYQALIERRSPTHATISDAVSAAVARLSVTSPA